MTNVEIILVLASVSIGAFMSLWFVIQVFKASNERQKAISEVLKNPEVRTIILQLVRNKHYSSPKTASERRENGRRALAIIRLRKIVKDPSIRKHIYKLTDTSK